MRIVATLFCLLVTASLLLQNYFWFHKPVDISTPKEKIGQGTILPGFQEETRPDREQIKISATEFVQTFSRPLFNENRRPFTPPKPKPEPKPARIELPKPAKIVAKPAPIPNPSEPERIAEPITPPNIQLAGIAILPNKADALIVELDTRQTRWVTLDSKVNDWQVSEITSSHIVLSMAEQTAKYNLYEADDLKEDRQ